MFLTETSFESQSLSCIPLPPWEPISLPPCSPCHDAIAAQAEAHPRIFVLLPRTIPDDATTLPLQMLTFMPWRSSFSWYMDNVLEIDWSESKQLELLDEIPT